MKWLVLMLPLCCYSLSAANWYASPSASAGSGDGSIGNPWALQSAISNVTIVAGDTVWLRGGTHTSAVPLIAFPDIPWTFTISGSLGNPVTFRSYTNEWAKIDGEAVFGTTKHLRFRDLEWFDSHKGHNVTNQSLPHGPWAHFDDSNSTAPHYEWINCTFHDVDDLFDGLMAGDSVRGCIIWHVGIIDGEYVNSPGTFNTTNNFSGNIVAWTACDVLHGSPLTQIANSNIIFGTGQDIAGVGSDVDFNLNGSASLALTNNCTYNRYGSFVNQIALNAGGSVFAIGNTFVGQFPVRTVTSTNFTFTGNTVYQNWGAANYPQIGRVDTNGTWTINANSYAAISPNVVKFSDGNDVLTFSQWKARYPAFDTSSTATDGGSPNNAVYVFANQDAVKRAHVAVYNWTLANNVNINLSSVLSAGDRYDVYSAQNYGAGPIQSGIFGGTTITVPMTNLTVAPILYGANWGLVQPSPTSPEFGAFVVIGQPGATMNVTTLNVGTIK